MSQVKIPWWYTEIGDAEKKNVLAALNSKQFSMGSYTASFEREFAGLLGVRHAVATPSGTAALAMALLAAGVGRGDEVIVPALTWIATANAAAILGARVVLVDCQEDTPLIDIQAVRKHITRRTKAIIPVHLNGRACQMDELLDITQGSGIAVIEDTCKALMSKTSRGYLGTIGDMGCFSLGMVSLVSIGYGGMVVTNKREAYEKLLLIRNQGVPARGEERYVTLSFNFKISDLLAAIGLVQVSRVTEKLEHLNRVYRRYVDGISGLPYVELIAVDTASGKVPLCAEVRSKDRELIISYLEGMGVEPLRFHLPLQNAQYLENNGNFPNAARFAAEGYILPCGPSQSLDNVDRCIELLRKYGGSS